MIAISLQSQEAHDAKNLTPTDNSRNYNFIKAMVIRLINYDRDRSPNYL